MATLLVRAAVLAPSPVASQAAPAQPPQAPPARSAAEAWWRHVQVLAHDSLKGRDAGSPVTRARCATSRASSKPPDS
ncbi:MAG: hypothetical protein ACK54K_07725, partial [Gemmatimonadaceae bacterium]